MTHKNVILLFRLIHLLTRPAMGKTIEKFLEEVLVIMVTYRCSAEQSATWYSLVREASNQKAIVDLFVYDNTPEPQLFPASPLIRMEYRHNPLNPGVSRAYNEGSAVAREKKKNWILLLDQDTHLAPGWLEAYVHDQGPESDSSLLAPILWSGSVVVSPFRYWLTKGVPSRRVDPGVYSLRRYFAINSGLLIQREIFDSVGGYDESIPLDFSDFAFMSKLKKNHYKLRVIDLHGQHRLSSASMQDIEQAKRRFRQYCVGSIRFAPYAGPSFLRFLLGGGRAIRLAIRYRSLNFISILFQSWAAG